MDTNTDTKFLFRCKDVKIRVINNELYFTKPNDFNKVIKTLTRFVEVEYKDKTTGWVIFNSTGLIRLPKFINIMSLKDDIARYYVMHENETNCKIINGFVTKKGILFDSSTNNLDYDSYVRAIKEDEEFISIIPSFVRDYIYKDMTKKEEYINKNNVDSSDNIVEVYNKQKFIIDSYKRYNDKKSNKGIGR